MALVLKDRVKGWTDSYGEDNFVIFATTNGYQSFSVIGNGNQTYYTVFDPTNYDWEVGIGTYTAATTTLSRDTILSSSNNNLIVSFLPGTKELFVGYPAEKAVTLDTPQTITDKTLVSATVTSGTINNTTIGATTPASGAFTTLVASGASLTSVNAGVALLTSATVTTLNATGASIASANIGNLQFTAASIASINAGVAVITNLSATSASIASMNASVALLTTATVTNLTATGASIASANIGNLQFTAASIASINAGVAVITNLTATSASIASMNAGVALVTTATITGLTATGASVASANVGTAVVTGLTVTNASIASLNAGTATVTTGNLTFSSTGQRITGDMSNATIGNRLAFQTSTTNGNTDLNIIPNGTSVTSGIRLNNNSDTTNAGYVRMSLNSAGANIAVDINSVSGTYLPLAFNTGGSERMRLTTDGNLGIGLTPTASVGALQVSGGAFATSTMYVGQAGSTAFSGGLQNLSNTSRSISLEADPTNAGANTVMYFNLDGSTRMAIDSSGNVGIGMTPSTDTLLEVYGSAAATCYKNVNTGTGLSDGFYVGCGKSSSTDAYVYNRESAPLIFGTANAERMRITSAGSVGIGTASPGAALEVSSASNQSALFKTSATGSYGAVQIFNTNTNGEASIGFRDNSDSDATSWVVGKSVGATDALGFYYGATRMVIDTSGNVGIGTASPGTKLHLYGAGTTSTSYTNGDAAGATLYLQDSGASSGNGGQILFGSFFGASAGIKSFVTDGTGPAGDLLFQTRSTSGNILERMRITSGGDVAIGTTSALNSARLTVDQGTTNATTYTTVATRGGSLMTQQQQSTTSVSTSAVTILTPANPYASLCLVFGSDGTNRFIDLVLFSVGTGTFNVISSLSAAGTPAARTYSQSSSTYRVAMASGTYTVQVTALGMGT